MADGSIKVQLELDDKTYTSELNKAVKSTKASAAELESATGTISDTFGGVVKTVAALGAAAGVSFGAVVKSALDGYASLEQNIGGINKLFGTAGMSIEDYAKSVGKSTDEVKDQYDTLNAAAAQVTSDAKNAWKDVGVSANSYMEQVTSFSASLISSLGGDTTKAASYAKTAMVDMSDNANTFGTNIADIQHAYQGFAKQNYTMLDNLKLGYGGTKEEMERLISDANAVKAANGEMADLSIDSFADVVEAIHVMQEEMNIAGTTQREALTTIEGSVNAAKAAWENWLAGLGDDTADMSELTQNLVESIATAAGNIVPRVQVIIQALWNELPNLFSKIKSMLPKEIQNLINIVEQILPAVTGVFAAIATIWGALQAQKKIQDTITTVKALWTVLSANPVLAVVAVIAALVAGLVVLYNTNETVRNVIDSCWRAIQDTAAAVWPVIQQVITTVMTAIQNLTAQVWPTIQLVIQTVMQAINDFIANTWPVIQSTFQTAMDVIQSLISTVWPVLQSIITTSMKGIQTIISTVWPVLKSIFQAGCAFLEALINTVWPAIQAIIQTVMKVIQTVIQTIWPIIQQVIEIRLQAIQTVMQNVWNVLQTIVTVTMQVIQSIIQTVMAAINGDWDAVWRGIENTLTLIWDGMETLITVAITAILNIIKTILNSIVSTWSTVWQGISGVLSGIWNTMKSVASSAINGIYGTVSGVLNSIKNVWSSAWSTVSGALSSAWNGMKTAASNGVQNVYNVVSGIKSKITGFFSGAGSWLVNSGAAMLNGLKRGIENGISGAVNAVKSGLSKIRSFFPFSPAKQGPFSGHGYTTYSGAALMKDFGQGITAATSSAVNAAERGLETVQNAIGGVAVGALDGTLLPTTMEATVSKVQVQAAAQGATTTNYQTVNFNQPINSPDEVARTMRMQSLYGLAGSYA